MLSLHVHCIISGKVMQHKNGGRLQCGYAVTPIYPHTSDGGHASHALTSANAATTMQRMIMMTLCGEGGGGRRDGEKAEGGG